VSAPTLKEIEQLQILNKANEIWVRQRALTPLEEIAKWSGEDIRTYDYDEFGLLFPDVTVGEVDPIVFDIETLRRYKEQKLEQIAETYSAKYGPPTQEQLNQAFDVLNNQLFSNLTFEPQTSKLILDPVDSMNDAEADPWLDTVNNWMVYSGNEMLTDPRQPLIEHKMTPILDQAVLNDDFDQDLLTTILGFQKMQSIDKSDAIERPYLEDYEENNVEKNTFNVLQRDLPKLLADLDRIKTQLNVDYVDFVKTSQTTKDGNQYYTAQAESKRLEYFGVTESLQIPEPPDMVKMATNSKYFKETIEGYIGTQGGVGNPNSAINPETNEAYGANQKRAYRNTNAIIVDAAQDAFNKYFVDGQFTQEAYSEAAKFGLSPELFLTQVINEQTKLFFEEDEESKVSMYDKQIDESIGAFEKAEATQNYKATTDTFKKRRSVFQDYLLENPQYRNAAQDEFQFNALANEMADRLKNYESLEDFEADTDIQRDIDTIVERLDPSAPPSFPTQIEGPNGQMIQIPGLVARPAPTPNPFTLDSISQEILELAVDRPELARFIEQQIALPGFEERFRKVAVPQLDEEAYSETFASDESIAAERAASAQAARDEIADIEEMKEIERREGVETSAQAMQQVAQERQSRVSELREIERRASVQPGADPEVRQIVRERLTTPAQTIGEFFAQELPGFERRFEESPFFRLEQERKEREDEQRRRPLLRTGGRGRTVVTRGRR
jgi:ribonuclease HI